MGVAHVAASMVGPADPILVLCGPGNNGGDGYGAARFLRSWDRPVEVLICARKPPDHGDAGVEFGLLAREAPPRAAYDHPERVSEALDRGPALVVDALFGVGLSRTLEGPYASWIDAVNGSAARVLAVDVPSGIDSDSGEALPVGVRADATATMAAPKAGLAVAADLSGHVVEIDIGLPEALHGPYRLE